MGMIKDMFMEYCDEIAETEYNKDFHELDDKERREVTDKANQMIEAKIISDYHTNTYLPILEAFDRQREDSELLRIENEFTAS